MKRVIGILFLTVLCIALGLSVSWGKEKELSLICCEDTSCECS